MNRALVWKAIKTELGPPETVFRAFDTVPFAAASLGQVHAATAHDGSFLYFGRAEHGLMRLLEKLGAKVRMRSGMDEHALP